MSRGSAPGSGTSPRADRDVVLPAAGMAIGFGLLGWVLADRATRALWEHGHTGAHGTHYRHVDGHADTIAALAMAAVVAAIAGLLTSAIVRTAGGHASAPTRWGARLAAALPAAAFVLLQAPALGEASALPLVAAGAAVHAATGAVALTLARRCTREVLQRFALPDPPARVLRAADRPITVVLDLLRSLGVPSRWGTRAPPLLPAL